MVRTNISLWRRRRHEVIGSPDPEPSHDSPADALGLRDELVRGLRRLSEKQRVVLVLRYIYDQSVQEIAEQTGMNPGTVASHLSRARRAMRSHLDHPATVNVKAGR
ncbi:RNA polymerase sigma factor (sigma-70 family) [Nocardioides daedukensis]|uniref:RNA polymerase sigma factor (Sigma-70 family) n=2 Tax=Nocardioides daedukensis TaxID=634462 RepID=A0A7Y9UU76_9ACTN|nr:RNA polymerase sigma factor (sigma-70 family) [Nocardioides daedukensis]